MPKKWTISSPSPTMTPVNMMASMIAHQLRDPAKNARIRSLEFGNDDSLLTAEDLKSI